MGINPTPTNHRSFTFDGKSTREFGVYTTGKDVFNSPERAVEMISIPGRDGEYALDKGHFNNIEVTYRAGIVSDSTTDFAEAISNFRNWLASRKGYCRLTDEYNTEEYRMAVFKNAIALEHEGLLTGEFDVTFDCKPQRYLAIGEELVEIGAWGNTETVSGDIATFDAGSATKIKEVTVDITPVQSGSGTPSPDNIRPITGFSAVDVWNDPIHGGSVYWNQLRADSYTSVTQDGITTSYDSTTHKFCIENDSRTTNYGSGSTQGVLYNGSITVGHKVLCLSDAPTGVGIVIMYGSSQRDTIKANEIKTMLYTNDNIHLRVTNQYDFVNTHPIGDKTYFYLNIIDLTALYGEGNEPSTVAEFKELYYKGYYAYDSGTITCVSAVNGDPYEHTTTSLGTTVYGGTLDVVSGELTTTYGFMTFNGTEDWKASSNPNRYYLDYNPPNFDYKRSATTFAITNKYDFYGMASGSGNLSDGQFALYHSQYSPNLREIMVYDSSVGNVAGLKTALSNNNLTVCYELNTPTTTTLTAQQVAVIANSVNNVWANSGDVTVEYGHDPAVLTNPTLFDSRPLLEVKGYGDIQLSSSRGTKTISLDSGQIGDISLANNISSYRIEVDPNMFEAGDTVTVDMSYQDFAIVLCTDGTYYNISRTSDSISDSNSDFSTTYLKSLPGAGLQSSEIVYRVTIPTFTFNVGTTSYITDVVSGTITCKAANPSANTFTATFSVTRRYGYLSSTNRITYDALYSTVTTTAAYVTDAIISNQKIYFNSVVGHSTLSRLGNPTYIDCDIGEAYLINDGTAVSLNSYIDLGSDLPTLPSGDTEVTYDNTITKVEVQPNWWKV